MQEFQTVLTLTDDQQFLDRCHKMVADIGQLARDILEIRSPKLETIANKIENSTVTALAVERAEISYLGRTVICNSFGSIVGDDISLRQTIRLSGFDNGVISSLQIDARHFKYSENGSSLGEIGCYGSFYTTNNNKVVFSSDGNGLEILNNRDRNIVYFSLLQFKRACEELLLDEYWNLT